MKTEQRVRSGTKAGANAGGMALPRPLASAFLLAISALSFSAFSCAAQNSGPPSAPPRPVITRQPPQQSRPQQSRPQANRPRVEDNSQPHLDAWLERHQDLSPAEQERALRSEPGFSRLAPPAQQKLVDRLHQIDNMPPQQRQRTLERIENMERLDPERRQEIRSSVQLLHGLPPERERMVKQAFHELREYSFEQRQAILASGQYNHLTGQERGILSNILSVEPYVPPENPTTPLPNLPSNAIR